MRRPLSKIKGLGFILWQCRHLLYHVLIGLVWAWMLREVWNDFNRWYVLLSVVGSLLPDADHLWYFFTYGNNSAYTQEILKMFKAHQWRSMAKFISQGHKYQTNLSLHNIYITFVFFGLAAVAFYIDRRGSAALFGAVFFHYIFDVFDDWVTLGQLNPNWKRWGRGKLG